MTQQHTQLNAHTSHLTSLVLAVTDELLGVGRAQRAILLASYDEPSAGVSSLARRLGGGVSYSRGYRDTFETQVSQYR